MDSIDVFQIFISGYSNGDLPGIETQNLMSPKVEGAIRSRIFDKEKARKSGVLLLMTLHQSQPVLIMIKRTNKGIHGGQISFPGGEVEVHDSTYQSAAIRETYEEIGVLLEEKYIIGPLSDLYVPPSNFYVKPYCAIYPYECHFTINSNEVEQMVLLSLNRIYFDFESGVRNMQRNSGMIEAPFFKYDDHIIWGASAMILNEWLTIYRRK